MCIRDRNADYGNFLEDLAADLADTLRIAEAAGIRDDKIILDPGVGFGKTYEDVYKRQGLRWRRLHRREFPGFCVLFIW